MSILEYTRKLPPHPMNFITRLDQAFELLFDKPPLRHAAGITAIAVGVLNVLDMRSGLSSVLISVYGLPPAIVDGYMLLLALSGVGLVFSLKHPARNWHIPLILYLFLTFTGYLSGAVLSANTWAFALKALFSVGFAWWLYTRAVRRGDV